MIIYNYMYIVLYLRLYDYYRFPQMDGWTDGWMDGCMDGCDTDAPSTSRRGVGIITRILGILLMINTYIYIYM